MSFSCKSTNLNADFRISSSSSKRTNLAFVLSSWFGNQNLYVNIFYAVNFMREFKPYTVCRDIVSGAGSMNYFCLFLYKRAQLFPAFLP